MYKQIKMPTTTEIVINKSTFIGTTFKCRSEEEGKDKVSDIKKKYHDATHNCSAFISDMNGIIARFSDDGEPSGTAGKPILEVLKNKKLAYTGVVVTRYFGGIKLGAGGLVRAYTKSATDALNASKISIYELGVKQVFYVSYPEYQMIMRYFQAEGVEIVWVSYETAVEIVVITRKEVAKFYEEKITDMTNGKSKCEFISEEFYPFQKA